MLSEAWQQKKEDRACFFTTSSSSTLQYVLISQPDLPAVFMMDVLPKIFPIAFIFSILLEKQFGDPNIPLRSTSCPLYYCLNSEKLSWVNMTPGWKMGEERA